MKAAAALPSRPPQDWDLPPPYGWRSVGLVMLVALLLLITGQRLEMGRMAVLTGEALQSAVGLRESSQVGQGLSRLAQAMLPLQIAERTEVARIEGFDPARLPWLSHLEVMERRVQKLDPKTLQMAEQVERQEVLVEPVGYLIHVLIKMLETLEIALWGTLLAVLLSLPLSVLGAHNYSPHRLAYAGSRMLVSLLRAVPELISALFLVLAYGFGPIAGVLALALHGAGFLGKFYAEDIENTAPRPQQALLAIGAGRLAVLRQAVLPEVLPKYTAYTLYLLDRNVRMATVVGLVGAGGIGQELKGRYDMYQYAHVATILLAIFATVYVLDIVAARLRRRMDRA
jgi:phosphonate transport system permease protein